ncbi:FAD-dependent monooxygenase [Pararhodobacter aggregans]|uniref:3-hydroxybenzoate 4-monooxygenase n=1 Tax=Pararhodobacter aggregans TaxID=404875 RepID=A0A2T7UPW3_9RHOB|nr:FAD-dependent monooxygenase [Pararhodobacter aggregans]PTX01498.1 phenol 2-monooxygenase [Pararhodobacter aggregans]PVE46770.1 3-hydroxybenzoate 4-monooxygenase [Pararhodobacter aggregans]
MQYHRNGFRAGDPDILAPGPRVHDRSAGLPRAVDVLIAGCGPAGLCLAAQLALEPGIHTMIVEPKPGPIEKGQADGISVRSMEMFGAFGFAEKISREAVWINETTFWTPGGAGIQRVARVQDVPDGMSEMPHVLINQARIHDMYLDIMKNSPTRLVPDYGLRVADLVVGTEGEYPVTVTLEHTAPGREGETEVVRAKYVVGCDGARSSVRRAIGGALHGDAAHHAWGVIDLLAVTDFPDWRMKAFVRSEAEGTLMVLPREGGHLVRLYVELDRLGEDERAADRGMDDSHIIAKAQRIFAPYRLDVKEVVWWSIYEVGHRLTDKFDDVPQGEVATRAPRVMLAGDACHTHSPKAGQGMNVSMGDTFNMGWKLRHVLTGRAAPSLLHSYTEERRAAAKGLVDFDHEWARIVGAKTHDDKAGELPVVAQAFVHNLPFTCGLTIQYAPSALTGGAAHQALAPGFDLGKRFHSAPVIRLADAKPMELGHCIEADARWRLFVFAPEGDVGQPGGPVASLCDWLEQDPASPVLRHRREGDDIDAVIDVRAVFQPGFRELDYGAMPALLRPQGGALGLRDYEKVFCVDHKRGVNIYDARGIDKARGCLVVVRPDQYVAQVLPLSAREELTAFFGGFLV